jgi:hypothetical protein
MKTITLFLKKAFFICFLLISFYNYSQTINITGNSQIIPDGETSTSTSNFTDFGITNSRTFIIDKTNNGNPKLNITSISLSNSTDFTITDNPAPVPSTANDQNFTIGFNSGTTCGVVSSVVYVYTDATNDGTDNVWTFTISSTRSSEINILGNATTISSGDLTPDLADNTIFPTTDVGFSSAPFTYTIENTGNCDLDISSITVSTDFTVTASTPATIGAASSTTFSIIFNPTTNGTTSSTVTINNTDSDENPYTFTIQGQGIAPLTEGPGGVVSNLQLWLKGNDGLGYSDGDSVALWATQGRGTDATVNTPGQEPTYKDNVTDNVNFNPVVDFDNSVDPVPLDGDFSYDDTSTQFLEGTSGYYSQDIFTVLIPDVDSDNTFGSMDIFCGDEDIATDNTDATGIGLGKYTVRFTDEVLSYCHGPTASGDGYGVAEVSTSTTYDNAGIINVRNNAGATQQELYYNAIDKETTQNDVPDFANVNDARYWIGRSEGWEASTDARIAEIVTYSSRKTDTDLTVERNRIMSYLAIKYGITLGINGTSQDYVDSDGTVIWDVDTGVPANDAFNYDIAGIGRDDISELHQKQSRSVNNAPDISDGGSRGQGVLTIGISSIYDTNNLNPSTDLTDKHFLMWGNNGVDLDDGAIFVEVDMSTGISPAIVEGVSTGTKVHFNGIPRTWKVVENVQNILTDDIPTVEVAILKNAVRTAAPPNGVYLMFISDTPNFDPTADYRVMSEDVNELGEAIVKTNYDFDGTKYITFGWAPEDVYVRSIYFDGMGDYVDMENTLNLNQTEFTISSWIKRGINSSNTSILSKRDVSYTEGYDLKITSTGKVEMSWKNGSTQTITSNTTIPTDEWHQVAIIYTGGNANLYIDGILDKTEALSAPTDTSQSFYLGAAGKLAPTAFFEGNIDEVRVWDTALTVDQLRYVMNQEIKENGTFVGPTYFVDKSVTPSKNETSTLPWADLAAYYPMSTYTYTNTKDESGNGNQGALRQLRTVDRQTAPLPYISNQNGDWDTSSTWINGNVQTIPGSNSIVDNTKTIDWNIIQTNHNITLDNSSLPSTNNGNRSVLGLFVDSNKLTVIGDTSLNSGYGLTVSHYLYLDGDIDLEGESQLIQTTGSDLAVTSAGKVERDQQGTADTFIYNYWSSPVGIPNTTSNNNSYTLPNVMRDGTQNINWITSGYNGTDTAPVGLADYWVWKYANQLNDNYASWQHVRSSGTIQAGEGFTMKGPGSGTPSEDQNYVFVGKPNNGDITLTLSAGNDYLIGNPYASAIDANEFILDNTNTGAGRASTDIIDGSLYFWEHFANATHNLAEYEGGYATRNLIDGVKARSNHILINASGVVGEKIPGRYIPVSQGFFVTAFSTGDNNISFKNSQRVFRKEGDSTSVFMKTNNKNTAGSIENADTRQKIWLMFDSSNGYHRQILAGVDENATDLVDIGYDAKLNEYNAEDMFWEINSEKFVIQGVSNFDTYQVLPLGVKANTEGEITIRIDELQNIPESTDIFIHDTVLDTYHDLRENDFSIYLTSGMHTSRFEIVFETDSALGINDDNIESIDLHYSNSNETIILVNPNYLQIDTIELFDMLGKSIQRITEIPVENTVEIKASNLSSGTYILKASAEFGITTKKVIIN